MNVTKKYGKSGNRYADIVFRESEYTYNYSSICYALTDKIKKKIKDIQEEKISDDKLHKIILSTITREYCEKEISEYELIKIEKVIFNAIRKYGVLQEFIDDETVSEIMVNGYNSIFIERKGEICDTGVKFESEKKLFDIIQKMVADVNRIVNEANPIVDARLENGSRIHVVLPPVALDGPILTIRKFSKKPIELDELVNRDLLTKEAADFLITLVKARFNIFIAGGTSSGKTTFLNALSRYIGKDERVITIEDSAELQLNHITNIVRLEARNANIEGNNEVSIRDLIKASMRLRPDRIIIGEVRDQAAMDLLNAYNTGHDGSMSTGHSNSAKDMIGRLENMALMAIELPIPVIREKIATALDIIIYMGRLSDKSRRVLEISEIVSDGRGNISLNTLFKFKQEECIDKKVIKGKLIRTKNNLQNKEKILKARENN